MSQTNVLAAQLNVHGLSKAALRSQWVDAFSNLLPIQPALVAHTPIRLQGATARGACARG